MATIYIDPSATTNGDGSLATPFNSFPTITSGNTYLIKRGTTLNSSISINASNVNISTYSFGNKPKIIPGATDRWSVRVGLVSNIFIEELECTGALGNGSQTTFGIYLGSDPANICSNVTISSCYIHDIISFVTVGDCSGIFGFGDNITVKNCRIDHIADDGIWLQGLNPVIIGNRISNVGEDSSITGDCIQLNGNTSSTTGFPYVMGNYLDHSSRLEKQCFIVSGASLGNGGLFAFNTCIFPTDPNGVGGNACGYSDQPGFTFLGNRTYGGTYGFLIDTGINQSIIGNVIQKAFIGINHSASPTGAKIYQNTIVDSFNNAIYWNVADATSEIKQNIIFRNLKGISSHGSVVKSKNCYFNNTQFNWGSTAGGGSIDADAILVDPLLNTNFVPKALSTLIAAGSFLVTLQDRNSSTFWTTPSIGAYEYMRTRTFRS